jgi:hypothetical protein
MKMLNMDEPLQAFLVALAKVLRKVPDGSD